MQYYLQSFFRIKSPKYADRTWNISKCSHTAKTFYTFDWYWNKKHDKYRVQLQYFPFDEHFLIVNIKICHVQTTRLRFSMSRNYKADMDKHKLDFFTWHVFLKRGCMNCTMDRKPIFSWAYVKAHYLIYGQEYMYFRILLKVSFEWKYRSYI